jgi:small GTP-binding protein
MKEVIYNFKVVVIGPSAVGKTSIINRFIHDSFSLKYQFTMGVDFLAKSINLESEKIAKLIIWDIGGQERFDFLHRSFYAGTNGALLVFDLSREHTFTEIDKWLKDLWNQVGEDIPFILIGNKSDLIPQIGEIIDKDEIKNYVKVQKAIYLDTSAKTGEKVETAFAQLTDQMNTNFNKKKRDIFIKPK